MTDPYVTEGSDRPMYHESALKPTWWKVFLSLIPAFLLGWAFGQLLDMAGHCAHGRTDCVGYSLTKIVLAYVFSWPLLVLDSALGKYVGLGVGIVPLWLYYYFLACLADYGERLVRERYLE